MIKGTASVRFVREDQRKDLSDSEIRRYNLERVLRKEALKRTTTEINNSLGRSRFIPGSHRAAVVEHFYSRPAHTDSEYDDAFMWVAKKEAAKVFGYASIIAGIGYGLSQLF